MMITRLYSLRLCLFVSMLYHVAATEQDAITDELTTQNIDKTSAFSPHANEQLPDDDDNPHHLSPEIKDAITPSNENADSFVKKQAGDDEALAILQTADHHRNHRFLFSLETSLQEALNLYHAVLNKDNVSPDLKARAKINIAKISVFLASHQYNPMLFQYSKDQIIHLINDVLTDPQCSIDTKGWARRFQAKLYLKGFYTNNPHDAAIKAYAALHENLSIPTMGHETRSRTRMQIAQGYLAGVFKADNVNSIELAQHLYQDVINDPESSADIKIKCRLALATYTEFFHDMPVATVQKKRFQLFQEALKENTPSPTMLCELKHLMAKNLIIHAFPLTPEESDKLALQYLQEIATEGQISDKQRLFYTTALAEYYLHSCVTLKPSEAKEKALKIYRSIPQQFTMSVEQGFEYHMILANYHVKNIFMITPKDAKIEAVKIYHDLIQQTDLPPKHKAEAKWTLANLYATKVLPHDDAVTEAIRLFKEVLDDTALSTLERQNFLINLRGLCAHNAFADNTPFITQEFTPLFQTVG